MRGLLLLLLLASGPAAAAFVKSDICPDYRVSRRGDDLLIYCPPTPPGGKAWGTWKDAYVQCPGLRVRRDRGDLYITCQ